MKMALLLVLWTILGFNGCQPGQHERSRTRPPRTWGRPKPYLFVPDTVIYALVEHFVENPVMKWEQGGSVAPFSFGQPLFDGVTISESSGPDVSPEDLAGLMKEQVLSATDTAFYGLQARDSRGFQLDAARLKGYAIVPTDSIRAIQNRRPDFMKEVYRRYGHSIYGISLPLFSKNFNVATLIFTYWCGFKCAVYYTVTIRRHGNQWLLVKILSTAQS
ncbi:hypothetical protein [Hymenobacter sp. B1770]|uniref:hypothetical protein n=1 Tax=Hymenobacter sp. B1770 TaxID=1718788 RepID=UPI003CF6F05D